VKVKGERKDTLIQLVAYPKVNEIIDIIIVDILEEYGLLLSRNRL
jgi:hypothetical protein